METLFTLSVPTTASGTITATTTASPSRIYFLTFSSSPDNRLTTPFLQTLLLALDAIERRREHGVLVTTSGIGKFYSNGLDLEHALGTEGFWEDSFYKVMLRLLTYPMPTIALLNGHTFAGGMLLACAHDYRVLNPSRGFLCMNEVDLGVAVQPAMAALIRARAPTPAVLRAVLLEGKRFGGEEALSAGLVDVLGGREELLKFVETKRLAEKTKGGVWARIRAEAFRELVGLVEAAQAGKKDGFVGRVEEVLEATEGEAEKRVAEWEKGVGKAKL